MSEQTSQFAIFIDGPLVGTLTQLPAETTTWDALQLDTQPWVAGSDDERVEKISVKTVVYRPVMAGVGVNVALWAVGDALPTLDSFIQLIWPVLKLAEEIEHLDDLS